MDARPPTSVVLATLLPNVTAGHASLGQLFQGLGDRSFGLVLLLLGLLGLVPGISGLVGILLLVPAMQMMLARSGPVLPRRLAARRFRAPHLARLLHRTIPVLRYLERFIRPRWITPFEATKRVVGTIVLLLGCLLLVPIPLSNLPIALVLMLIAFAYLEEDGVLLLAALIGALLLLATAGVAAWEAMSTTGWVGTMF